MPSIQLAQVYGPGWAISSRGFNIATANKLLVLIDGRTVYSPLFSGVFWDVQDLVLADIDRIEVIRGPGGTLWGANAVNGVVNIITKRAADTLGALRYLVRRNRDAGDRHREIRRTPERRGRLSRANFTRDDARVFATGAAGKDDTRFGQTVFAGIRRREAGVMAGARRRPTPAPKASSTGRTRECRAATFSDDGRGGGRRPRSSRPR